MKLEKLPACRAISLAVFALKVMAALLLWFTSLLLESSGTWGVRVLSQEEIHLLFLHLNPNGKDPGQCASNLEIVETPFKTWC